MNEAVVLAKRYASEDAARLVNGILARWPGRRSHVTEPDPPTRPSRAPRSCSSG